MVAVFECYISDLMNQETSEIQKQRWAVRKSRTPESRRRRTKPHRPYVFVSQTGEQLLPVLICPSKDEFVHICSERLDVFFHEIDSVVRRALDGALGECDPKACG
jgi:hypothetical protein